MKSGFFLKQQNIYIRLFLLFWVCSVLLACSLKSPKYDEIIGLTPELPESGNSMIRTQTRLVTDSEFVILQAQTIDGHQVGVKYMSYEDFKKISIFPERYSFGKRVIIVPPGPHVIEISYSGRTNYVLDSQNQENSTTISYNATIPADSICALLPEFESYRVELSSPKITLLCREKPGPL